MFVWGFILILVKVGVRPLAVMVRVKGWGMFNIHKSLHKNSTTRCLCQPVPRPK